MSGESFRFILASDFHLETPLGDLDQLPPHLADALATAPADAARNVFEAALADNIDFLVLTGDLLNPVAAGPHGMSVILDGLDQLHTAGKPVYWAAGTADDPQRWPEAIPMPSGITLFPKDRPQTILHERGGRSICALVGRSSQGRSGLNAAGFQCEPQDVFTIGVGHGTASAEALAQAKFDYWALGGPHNRLDIAGGSSGGASAPGSPQGRDWTEPGAHGYLVVDVDADGNVRSHQVATDRFRYCHTEISTDEIRTAGSLRNVIGQQLASLTSEHSGRHLLCSFEVMGGTAETLQSIGDPAELVRQLRRDHGQSNPAAWVTRLTIHTPSSYPKSWTDEDTILGDFLRAADKLRKQGLAASSDDSKEASQRGSLMAMTEEHSDLSEPVAQMLGDMPADSRETVLNDAVLLGVDLLRGGKLSVPATTLSKSKGTVR
ncbi:MAG: DNA repair exonuclease [Planctomycetota bacterium]